MECQKHRELIEDTVIHSQFGRGVRSLGEERWEREPPFVVSHLLLEWLLPFSSGRFPDNVFLGEIVESLWEGGNEGNTRNGGEATILFFLFNAVIQT